jgi:hypothetical protein
MLSNMHAKIGKFNKIELFQYGNRYVERLTSCRLFTNLPEKSKNYYKNVI